ncbi:MAG: hypothetical protein KAW14_12215 [Candidatus Aegiribacteria sp.]|nr:hypothetical protein [Candidatus Aegiribacteria sp.]
MLFVILAIVVGSHGFEILDQTDQEWVAPGYQIEETVINPFDYVESIGQSTPSVACYAFFPNPEDETVWRLIIVGRDKLVVLQEDWESPFELNLPFDTVGAVFSRNGRYVIVREGTYTNDQAMLINIDSVEVSYFDPTPDDTKCGLVLADNGTVAGVGHDFLIDFSLDLKSSEVREYTDLYIRNIGISADSRIIVLENVIDRPREIMAFDWDGRFLWTVDIGDRTVVDPLAVSSDGSFAAASFTSDGFMLLDGITGRILTEQFVGYQSSYASISSDGSRLAIPTALSIDGRPDNMILAITDDLCRSGTLEEYRPQPGWGYSPKDINNNGECLITIFRTSSPWDSRLGLVDRNGELIWCSELWTGSEHNFSIAPNYYNIDLRLRSILGQISPVGSCAVYMDKDTGYIHILNVEWRNQ